MNDKTKHEIVSQIAFLLAKLVDLDEENQVAIDTAEDKQIEMLTVKECTEIIKGLSEHTVRKLVKQDKVKYIRTGEGKNGKILVNKADLIKYMNS